MGALAACGDQCVGWHLLTPVTPSEVFHPFIWLMDPVGMLLCSSKVGLEYHIKLMHILSCKFSVTM